MQILLAEDEPAIRTTCELLLKSNGHKVRLASDGHECLEIYSTFTNGHPDFFDLVILDYRMPIRDGLECAKEISAVNPRQKILLMTAYSTDDFRAKIGLPTMRFLQKPFTGDELISAVESSLK